LTVNKEGKGNHGTGTGGGWRDGENGEGKLGGRRRRRRRRRA